MDPIRVGLALRALRIRRGWRQVDLAERTGVSRSTISSIEHGGCDSTTLQVLQAVTRALDARIDLAVRWRGEALDRLLDAAHAALVEQTVRLLEANEWEAVVEVSFAIFGERGAIDVLARHDRTRSVLVVEVKSVVPDSQAMLHDLDRKARLAARVASDRGWGRGLTVSRLLVIGDGSTPRRRVASLAATYDAAFPSRGAAVRRWLHRPAGPISGLVFLPFVAPPGLRRPTNGNTRVRGPRRTVRSVARVPIARATGEWERRRSGIGAPGPEGQSG